MTTSDASEAKEAKETVIVGFDSAWVDNPKKPGAICAAVFQGGVPVAWHPPRLVGFAAALVFVRSVERPGGSLLLALDQPTIVPNETGSRPVDKIAGSLISWMGGGVQPANRGRKGMFDEAAPIWAFIDGLAALQEPESARLAAGRYLVEVFPALALAALQPTFLARLGGPRYNPERRKSFTPANWSAVLDAVEQEAIRLGCPSVGVWLDGLRVDPVRKAHQDQLDSIICLLVAIRWRFGSRTAVMIGCSTHGYMVTPVTPPMLERLALAAASRGVPVDGILPPVAEARP